MPENAGDDGGAGRFTEELNEAVRRRLDALQSAARAFKLRGDRMIAGENTGYVQEIATLTEDAAGWNSFVAAVLAEASLDRGEPRRQLERDIKHLKLAVEAEWTRRLQRRQRERLEEQFTGPQQQRVLPQGFVAREPQERLAIMVPPTTADMNAMLMCILRASHDAGTIIVSNGADLSALMLSSHEIGTPAVPRLTRCDRSLVMALMLNEFLFSAELGENINIRMPPSDVVTALLKLLIEQAPRIRTRSAIPWLNSDHIVTAPYYERSQGVWHDPMQSGIRYIYPEHPTEAQRDAAVRIVKDIYLGGFKFKSQADRANALGAALMAVVQPGCDSRSPPFLVTKPQPNSGGSWLCRMLTMTATGMIPAPTAWPTNDPEEQRKLLFALLRVNPAAVFIDNVMGTLSGENFSLIAESDLVTGRVLGISEAPAILIRALIFLSGNNVTVSRDVVRRIGSIRLDSFVNDSERDSLRHGRPSTPDDWLKQSHKSAVEALLTMTAWWLDHGRERGRTLDSYEAVTGIVGGILAACGIEGWLGNRSAEELSDILSAEENDDAEAVAVLWEMFGTDVFKASEIPTGTLHTNNRGWPDVAPDIPLPIVLKDNPSSATIAKRLGKWLGTLKDGIYAVPGSSDMSPEIPVRVTKTPRSNSNRGWHLVISEPQGELELGQ